MHLALCNSSYYLRWWKVTFVLIVASMLLFTLLFAMGWHLPAFAAPIAQSTINCDLVSEILPSHCKALEALYTSTNGSNWLTKTGWLQPNTSPCSWYGILCSGGQIEINLSNNQLAGTLPSQIGDLSTLKRLYLMGNRIHGELPLAVCQLQQLEVLFLGNGDQSQSPQNALTGTLPVCVGSMSALTDLRISATYLTGPIPPELGRLTLKNLYLPSNRFIGSIPLILTNQISLTALDLANNQLDGVIPSDLGKLKNLERLYLGNNRFSGDIPPELGNLTKTVNLRLENNRLQGPIPATLGNLKNIEELRLQNNALTGSVPSTLVTVGESYLSNPSNTFTLNLDRNLLTVTNPAVEQFLRIHNNSFFTTQTLPPTDLKVLATTATSVTLAWEPIAYQTDLGFYELEYTTSPSVLYTKTAQTANKQASTLTVDNLCPGRTYEFTARTHSLPQGLQRNRLTSGKSVPASTITTPRAVDLLLLPILATDSNLDEYYAEYIAGIQEATARDTRIMALVLADRSNPADPDTRILKIQCGQVERLTGLPSLDLAPTALDATLREYDMTNPLQLAAFIRWARTTLGGEAPAGDVQSIKTVVSYVGHGLPIAPATDISKLVKNPENVIQSAEIAGVLRGLPPAPTKIPATPDQLTDQTSLTLISPYALTQALVLATDNVANPITVLDIVHCFGGTIEELYELSNPGGQPVAEMVVTSPNYTYAGGLTFTKALLSIRPTQTARELAEALVAAYAAALAEADGYDDNPTSVEHPRIIVAVDLSKVAAIKAKIDEVAIAVLDDLAQSGQLTKDRLLAAHGASVHYDTVPSAYAANEDPTNSCPHDFRLTANDALSDLTSFANQLVAQFESPSVRSAATAVIATANDAVLARTHTNGVPWFAHNPALEPWTFDGAGGIAIYTDFHGIRVGEITYIGWQAHWYTSTVSVDNLHPYQFVQGEHTWANVMQSYWADQLGSDGVKTMACVTLLPHLRPRQLYLPVIQK